MDKFRALWRHTAVRRVVYLCVIVLLWQALYMSGRFPEIMFPSAGEILTTLAGEILDGSLIVKTGYSLYLIGVGMLLSLVLAVLLTILAMLVKTVRDVTGMLISILDPLPGIALLPLAILWIGIGEESIIFVMVHSVLWPILLNVIAGFDSVPVIYQEVGRSFGMPRLKLIARVYVPAAFPSILTGIKTGWARAWRALISAEMVFGATGTTGGLGWDIYTKRSYLDMPGMFASLLVIMAIGILVEEMLFKVIERKTLRKWGMVR